MRRSEVLWASFLALFLAGCSGGGGGGGDDSIRLSGSVLFVPENVPLTDLGAGGGIDQARTSLRVGSNQNRVVRGRIDGGHDSVRLRSNARVAVTARLSPESNARLAHLDPISLEMSRPAREVRFLARGPFELLVHGDDGAYKIDIESRPLRGPVELDGHLGAFAVGDALEVRVENGGRASLSCAENLDMLIDASGELAVRDALGLELGRLTPAGGSLRIPAATLASFEIVARGNHARPLSIRAEAAAESRPLASVRALDHERAQFGLDGFAALATAVELEFVPGEMLVRAIDGSELAEVAAHRSARLEQRIPETSDLFKVDLPTGLDAQEAARTTLAAIAAFEVSERVEFAEPNRIRRALGGPLEPNDTFYNLQKHHYDLINMPNAWGITQGSASVIVAVIDTGIRSHPDLNGNDAGTGFDFISSTANAGDGGGLDNDPTDPGDGNGLTPSSFHGTHVAGTVGALGNNNSGVTGVNWDVGLMHLRVLGLQGGTDADIAQAVRYAAGLTNSSGLVPPDRADIINMSLGGAGSTQTMQSAVTAARNAGVVIFAAAGNNNSSQSFFPASYNGVVSVSAVDRNAAKAPYSNFGPNVDIAAPGGDTSVDLDADGFVDGVLSTLVDENNGFSANFVFYQGTSMACPHVAGVAALMLAVNPALTPAQTESFLQNTAVDLGAPGRDNIFGHGLMQADLAVIAAQGNTSPTPVLSASPTALNFGTASTLLNIAVANVGGGALDVGAPTFTPNGLDPVFATLQVVASTGSSDVSAVRVTVDRTGLADGSYSGVVNIPSNGGAAAIDVTMDVVTAPTPVDVDLFLVLVRIVDPDTLDLESVAQADLNPTTTLDWEMVSNPLTLPIPRGDYILVCGSDDDVDGFIGGTGDTYFGAWPSINEVVIIELAAGSRKNSLDFVVAPSQSTLTTNPSGWRKPIRLLNAPNVEEN